MLLNRSPAVSGWATSLDDDHLDLLAAVRRGQRLVSITFIESLIPDEFLRTQLYELNEVAALEGLKMDWSNRVRLEAVRNNLLRLWSRT